ncbi:hypothetical protein BDV36DRAFT_94319 [Aspergillus pseudocaelatus]|uniref:Uncharacterized protein n=1 Tax=Aspergillus pseudocaelatus TaxID=1825620 RepID=A0ABQ6X4S1_9EURO|nr:hypothetical protein BDV36DRAFT_94319 [Aspergillus pseudocaelatus]
MLATWAEPSTFLEKRLEAPEAVQQNLFLRVCDLLRKPNHFLIEDRVRFRICCVLFHHLFKWCEGQVTASYKTPQGRAPFKKNVILKLAQAINQWDILPCGEAVTEREIRTWVGNGERYQQLLVDLGGPGSLFLLPNEGEGEYLSVPLSLFD